MKLRNKKTGEIGLLNYVNSNGVIFIQDINAKTECESIAIYHSLAELNEEWEDYEESKEYWYMNYYGEIDFDNDDGMEIDKDCKELGNYFNTREEAEKAVEKLKAWKRLRDKGFRFTDYDYTPYMCKGCGHVSFNVETDNINEIVEDMGLLFGGEDE